jgi:hypothetical protein
MSKHYRQVSIEEEGIPKEDGYYFTDKGEIELTIYTNGDHRWSWNNPEGGPNYPDPTWYQIELPSTTHVITEEELTQIKNQAFFEGYQTREQQLIEQDASRNFGGI